jgi:hypothetical protein
MLRNLEGDDCLKALDKVKELREGEDKCKCEGGKGKSGGEGRKSGDGKRPGSKGGDRQKQGSGGADKQGNDAPNEQKEELKMLLRLLGKK